MQEENFNILRLLRSENIGIKTFYNLKNHFDSAADIIEFLRDKNSLISNKKIKLADKDIISQEIEKTEKLGAKFIFAEDKLYPENLKHIADPPPFIIAMGNLSLLNSYNHLAVIGARNASFNSLKYTRKITHEINSHNFVTISGMARGIDTEAHISSLPNTIAVLPGGINNIYPPENKNLYQQIKSDGCLIAENKLDTPPSTYLFPQRNRIIAAIALATIIVEASIKSGSLITARFAINFNRDVYAVPGFPLDQKFSGNNYLIKNGAFLLDDPQEIFKNLQFQAKTSYERIKQPIAIKEKIQLTTKKEQQAISNLGNIILEKVNSSPVDIDEIARWVDAPIAIVQATIIELELIGKIARIGDNSIVNSSLKEFAAEFIY